jgi:hypothetical protein
VTAVLMDLRLQSLTCVMHNAQRNIRLTSELHENAVAYSYKYVYIGL